MICYVTMSANSSGPTEEVKLRMLSKALFGEDEKIPVTLKWRSRQTCWS